jgi:hypothetical protein
MRYDDGMKNECSAGTIGWFSLGGELGSVDVSCLVGCGCVIWGQCIAKRGSELMIGQAVRIELLGRQMRNCSKKINRSRQFLGALRSILTHGIETDAKRSCPTTVLPRRRYRSCHCMAATVLATTRQKKNTTHWSQQEH